MRWFSRIAVGVAVGAAARLAHADGLDAARDQALSEVSHTVALTVDEGVARYVVRRKLANRGTLADEARLQISLPAGAAVTGLRIRAAGRWHDGELMDADEAREVYAELTGVGPWRAKDPALLEWQWADEVRLRVFPVLPGKVNTVEYTLTAPLEYRDGRYVVSYPRFAEDFAGDGPLVEPVLRVDVGYAARLAVEGDRVRKHQRVALGRTDAPPWVGEGGPEPGDGYVSSALAIGRAFTATRAVVDVDIDHTFSGDLSLALVLPDGRHEALGGGEGSDNDIHDRFEVALDGVAADGTWHLVVSDQAGMDVGTLDAWSLELDGKDPTDHVLAHARGLPLFIPDASEEQGAGGQAVIEIDPPPIDTIAGRLGRVVASDVAGFSRLEIDVAPELRPLPRQASVVFVVDASHSAEGWLPDMLRVVEGYVAHVPDARIEVVRFDRKAARVFGEFVPARRAVAALRRAVDDGVLAPANGSAVEAGLELAAEILGSRRGATRIVAMTDTEVRSRFDNAMAHAALTSAPKGTIVHVVEPATDDTSVVTRDDDADLAPIAHDTGGVFFEVSVPESDKPHARKTALLELVRPVKIDGFELQGLVPTEDVPEVLREGDGFRTVEFDSDPPRAVTVLGKIWGEDFRRVIRHTMHFDRATAAFVFSEDDFDHLSEQEMRTVAYFGGAVSPVTSYLAVEPGVRPSTEGLERGGGGTGEGTIGLGSVGLIGRGGGGASAPPSLADLLARGAKACARRLASAGPWRVALSIETTEHEIVDVEVVDSSSAALGVCVEEASWAHDLPMAAWPGRKTHTVVLSG